MFHGCFFKKVLIVVIVATGAVVVVMVGRAVTVVSCATIVIGWFLLFPCFEAANQQPPGQKQQNQTVTFSAV